MELNTHTHANWVFTEPGVHLVRVTAQAQLKNGETVSDTKILRFAVSDTANAQQALNETWNIENFSASEIKDSHPSALDQNTALPFIVGGIIIAAAILVLGTVFVLRKNSEKAKSAGESLAAAASGKTVDVTTETAGESNRNE
ncbi:TIGR03769 domain-containing protein [Arcanobacterium hippocoleae]